MMIFTRHMKSDNSRRYATYTNPAWFMENRRGSCWLGGPAGKANIYLCGNFAFRFDKGPNLVNTSVPFNEILRDPVARPQICCQAVLQIPQMDICTMKSDKQIKSVIKSCFPERIYLPKSVTAWFFSPSCYFCSNVEEKHIPKCKFCCVNTSAWSRKTFPSANCNPPQHYWALQILPPRTAGWKTLLIWFSAGQQEGCFSENLNSRSCHHIMVPQWPLETCWGRPYDKLCQWGGSR